MTCKHRWEPSNFGIKYRTPDNQLYECQRCHEVISTMQTESNPRLEEKAREAWADALDDLRMDGKVL